METKYYHIEYLHLGHVYEKVAHQSAEVPFAAFVQAQALALDFGDELLAVTQIDTHGTPLHRKFPPANTGERITFRKSPASEA